jgi:hypothetical protein
MSTDLCLLLQETRNAGPCEQKQIVKAKKKKVKK